MESNEYVPHTMRSLCNAHCVYNQCTKYIVLQRTPLSAEDQVYLPMTKSLYLIELTERFNLKFKKLSP